MIQCPACSKLQASALRCDCGAPLGAELDYFEVFDLRRKLQIDANALEGRYHELGLRLHPDRFATASAKVRDASVRATALLTRAYRTLRDPVSRARYWLELKDRKLGDNNQVPAELAELVFEIQSELADFSGAQGPELESARRVLDERSDEVRELMEQRQREREALFEEVDRSGSDAATDQLEKNLAVSAYLGTLARNLEKALDRRAAA